MPTRNAGPPASANAAASRSREPVAALRDDAPSRPGSQAPGAAVEHEHAAAAGRGGVARRERVLERRARQRRGLLVACTAGTGASSRARGAGAFAITSSVGAHVSTAAMSRTARAVPRTVPVTFERPARGW